MPPARGHGVLTDDLRRCSTAGERDQRGRARASHAPWGAVKGFGQFRNDQSLSQEQIELITSWVDGGIRRGNNPNMLPKPPQFPATPAVQPDVVARVSGPWSSDRPITLDGLLPERVGDNDQMRIVAVFPDGRVEPLLWLHNYDSRQPHPFFLRRPILMPVGTEIRGVSQGALVSLLRR